MKKYLLGVIALALAMGFSAFTTDFHGKRDTTFFKYIGTTPDGYTDASNWQISSNQSGCSEGHSTCMISSDQFTSTQQLANYLENVHTDPQSPDGSTYQIVNKKRQLTETE
jgi:hypothetical protein